MKKIFILLSLACILFACKDKSDEPAAPAPVQITSANLTDAEAVSLSSAPLPWLQTLSSSYSFLLESGTESTISFEGTDDKQGPEVSQFLTKYNNAYAVKVFNNLYSSIGAANTALETIGAAQVSDKLTQATKDLTIARAKFIRGYGYFQLVQIFGEVPLILSSTSTDKTRASINDVYTQIVKDLTESKTGLPVFDSNKSNPSQGAANTILAKVYLTWGQNPLTQDQITAIATSTTDPVHTVDNAKLNLAVAYADSVILGAKYSLLTNFNGIFGTSQENGKEQIFTIHHDGDGIDKQGNHQTHCAFTFKFDLSKDNHIGPADPTLINRFDNNDLRKNYSYTTQLVNPLNDSLYNFAWPNTTQRYGKFIHRAAVGGIIADDAQPNDIDHIDFRYAEVLLIKAEALFFLNRTSDALPLINQIRQRAFGSNYVPLTSLTANDLYNEWDYEFTYEQKHWTNLVRWRTLISSVKTVQNFEYFKDKYATVDAIAAAFPGVTVNAAFFAKIYKHLHAKFNNVNGKFYRFPIPPGSSGQDLGIVPQNPGY